MSTFVVSNFIFYVFFRKFQSEMKSNCNNSQRPSSQRSPGDHSGKSLVTFVKVPSITQFEQTGSV